MTIFKRRWMVTGALALFSALGPGPAWANSKFLNVQGKLTDTSGNPLTGSQTVTFRLYTSSAVPVGSAIWSESQTVALSSGLFNVAIGSVTSLDSIAFSQLYYLGIQVAGDASELSPRQPLGASAYAQGSMGTFNVGNNLVVASSVTLGTSLMFGSSASDRGCLTGAGTNVFGLCSSSDGTTISNRAAAWDNAGHFAIDYTTTAASLTVGDNGFRTPGNMAVGTLSSPQARLELRQSSGADALRIMNGSLGSSIGWLLYNITSGSASDLRLWEYATSGSGDRVSFKAGGNVGIGTVAPSSTFTVQGTGLFAGAGSTLTVQGMDGSGYSISASSGIKSGGCLKFGDGTVQCSAAYYQVTNATYTRITAAQNTTNTTWTPIAGATVTLTANGNRILMQFACDLTQGSSGGYRAFGGFLVNGQFIDGEDDTHGFTTALPSGGPINQIAGQWYHLTENTYTGSVSIVPIYMTQSGGVAYVNIYGNSDCQMAAWEVTGGVVTSSTTSSSSTVTGIQVSTISQLNSSGIFIATSPTSNTPAIQIANGNTAYFQVGASTLTIPVGYCVTVDTESSSDSRYGVFVASTNSAASFTVMASVLAPAGVFNTRGKGVKITCMYHTMTGISSAGMSTALQACGNQSSGTRAYTHLANRGIIDHIEVVQWKHLLQHVSVSQVSSDNVVSSNGESGNTYLNCNETGNIRLDCGATGSLTGQILFDYMRVCFQ
jgi:hypothetical protein